VRFTLLHTSKIQTPRSERSQLTANQSGECFRLRNVIGRAFANSTLLASGKELLHLPEPVVLIDGMARLEVACFNTASALTAEAAGADRIEFCEGHAVGGTTPSYARVESLKSTVRLPVFVMIRPRGGDFAYSTSEYEQMKSDMTAYGQLVDGFVFGVLDSDQRVDVQRNSELVDLAANKPCTFHRAFDVVSDPSRALEDVIECGFKTILTSGGSNSAVEGVDAIASLLRQAGDRIAVMPGGSVRSSNIEQLSEKVSPTFFHTSGIVTGNEQADANELRLIKSKL
jgi:copper homeostasis protein